MRTPNTPRRDRTPEEQRSVEEGAFYVLLRSNFVDSFPPDQRPVAREVFRAMEAKHSGWSPEIEEAARPMVESIAAERSARSISAGVNNKARSAIQPADPVPGNEADDCTELGGVAIEEEMRFSLRAPDIGGSSPERPQTVEEIQAEMIQRFGKEEAAKRMRAAMNMESGPEDGGAQLAADGEEKSKESPVQRAYTDGIRKAI